MTAAIVSPDDTLGALRRIPTQTLIDALWVKGWPMSYVEGARPLQLGQRMAGRAVTLRFVPHRPDLANDKPKGEDSPEYVAIELCGPGEVLVIAGNGLPGWAAGENQINHSIQYGLTAWVTDLRMRDVGEIREMGFPVICNGATPETFDQEIVGMNVPVYVAGAQVRGGDIIVADDDGAVVIPIEAFNQVMVNVRDMAEKETEQEHLIKSKAPLDELLAFLATKGRAL